MELTLLKTVIVDKLRFLVNKLENMSKSYFWIMVLMALFGFISLLNSLIRYKLLYPEFTFLYIIKLYIGGTLAFFIIILLKSIILFVITRYKSQQLKFDKFLLGFVLFTIPSIIPTLINIFYPILYTHQGFSYSILSIASLLDFKSQNIFIGAILAMFDFFEIIQISSYAVFLVFTSNLRFYNSFLVIFGLEYLFYLTVHVI